MSKLNDLLDSMISSLNQKSSDGHLHATSDLSDIGAFETKITEESQFFSMLSLGNFPLGYLNSEGYLCPIPGQKMPVPSEFGLPTVQSGMADVTGYELVALLWRLYTMQQVAYIPFVVIDDISVDTDTIPLIIVASRMLEGSEEVLPLEVNASMHTCKTLIPGEVYLLAIVFNETTEQFETQIIGADYRFDTEPTENSPNLLSSGDIYNALQKIGTATGNVTKLSQLEEDTNHRLVTDTEKSAWNSKADGNHKHATTDLSDIDDFNQNLATTYAKKTELPTIPTKVSAFENDKGYLTEHQSLEGYAKTSDIPSLEGYAKTTDIPSVPTKVSAFDNDAGYLTKHQSLENYPTKQEVAEGLNKKQDSLDRFVESVNGYSGEVSLSAGDVHALPDTTVIPTVPSVVSAFVNDADYANKTYVAEVAAGKCKAYTFATVEELDSWLLNEENTSKLNNGDVFYIRAVGVPDYWWDGETKTKQILETTKVDLTEYAKVGDIPTKVSQLNNDANYTTEAQVDTKLNTKQDKLTSYVSSVNGKSGAVSLNASDVGALPSDTVIPTVPTKVSAFQNDAGYLTQHQDLSSYAKKTDIPTIPTKVSAFENDKGYLTQHQDLSAYAKKTDIPTVPSSLPANGGNADTVDGYHIRTGTSGAAGYITFVV